MAKFICVTQLSGLATFTGTSGLNYQSLRGKPFDVNNKEDISFFDKKRQFERYGLFSKPKVEEKSSVEEDDLEATLNEVDALSQTSKGKILSAYDLVSQVKDDIETDKKRFEIPERQLEALKSHLFEEGSLEITE